MKLQEAMTEATSRYAGLTPEQINEGLCFEWARIVFNLVEGSKIAGHNMLGHGHSYIEVGERCFDAECSDGVDDWWDLPFFKRVRKGDHEARMRTRIRLRSEHA